MLEIYIASVLFSFVCFKCSYFSMNKEFKRRYTKEEMKATKNMPTKYHPISAVIVYFIPVVNLAVGMIAVFKYGDLRDDTINDIDKFLQQEKAKASEKHICEIGDILYGIYPSLEIKEMQVREITIMMTDRFYYTTESGSGFYGRMIGKTVFLTKKEAEEKLKELQNNDAIDITRK